MTDYLKLDSKKIEIQWLRQGQKNHCPTLIFLHEGLGCADMWKDFPKKLSRDTGCPSLIFSRPGYGRSDPSPLPWKINFMHKQALKRLPEIIQKAKIKDYILIGHSDGGSISIIFAGSPYAEGLRGLITEAAHVFCEQITVECIQQAKINYEQHDLKQGLEKYHGINTHNAFRGWNDAWLNPRFMNWNIEKYLNRIQVPMLAIQGENDPYGTIKQIESISRGVKNIQPCVMGGCRHSPHLEQPQKTLSTMTRFIQKILAHKGC